MQHNYSNAICDDVPRQLNDTISFYVQFLCEQYSIDGATGQLAFSR